MDVTILAVQGYNANNDEDLVIHIIMVGIHGRRRNHITIKEAGVRLGFPNPF